MRFRAPAMLVFAVLAAGGCASNGPYWSREDRGAAERVELQERVADLERQLAAAGERNALLQSEVDTLRHELERSRARTEAAAPAAPERAERPPVEPSTGSRSEIEQSDLGDLDSPVPTASAPGADDPEAQELYDRSLDALQQQRLPEAEEGFARFLAAHPDSDLADNAQFWLAESTLRRGETAAALAAFRAVVERYPDGNKVPDALIKVGFCLAALGDPASAAEVYREILSRFPESAAAETARQRLGAP